MRLLHMFRNSRQRNFILVGVVLSILVAFPGFFTRPYADQVFMFFMPESLVGSSVLQLLPQAYNEIETYLNLGVFRPLSRLGFYVEHWLVLRTAVMLGTSPYVLAAVIKVFALLLLLCSTYVLIKQYEYSDTTGKNNRRWGVVYLLFPIIFSALLVFRTPGEHLLLRFPLHYLGTTAFALFVVSWLGQSLRKEWSGDEPNTIKKILAIILGITIAASMELAYLAIPLGVIHILLLSFSRSGWSKSSLKTLLKLQTVRLWAFIVTGFAIVALPVRAEIAERCAVNSCYTPATASFSLEMLTTWLVRIATPINAYIEGVYHFIQTPPSTQLTILILVLAVCLIGYILLSKGNVSERVNVATITRSYLPATLFFLCMLLFGALIAASSLRIQQLPNQLNPWRDIGFTWIAWSAILSLIVAMILKSINSRMLYAIMILLLSFSFAPSLSDNYSTISEVRATEDNRVLQEVGVNFVNFVSDETANVERCELLDNFNDRYDESLLLRNFKNFLNDAALSIYNNPFCQHAL